MAEEGMQTVLISEPGILALGAGLPIGPSIQSYFSGETIKQVACGNDHSAIVCESGKVFTFGKNQDNGWMENGIDTITVPMAVASLATVRVTQVACGNQFTLFVSDGGMVYSCGVNDYGQLGLGHANKSPSPVLVTGLPRIKKVSAGYYHSVALAVSGQLWVTGYNNYGQLGLDHTNNQSSFILIPNVTERIIDVACGGQHTALLLASRVLLMAGYNSYGQLGLGTIKYVTTFKQVSVPSTAVAAISCGAYHSVALRADGTVWCFGDNSHGQLGIGNKTNKSIPTQMISLEKHTITEVIAGFNHTALLTEQDLLVCGRGKDGEFGLEKEDFLMATRLTKSPGIVVKQIAFASSCSLMLVAPKTSISPMFQLECGATLKDDHVRDCITDWEKKFMKSLECPVCFKVMSKTIHQCLNGHSLCNTCRLHTSTSVCPLCKENFSSVRNLSLESMTAEIQLPCIDCLRRMPACELESHAEVCPNREYTCPLERSCGWSGRPDTMLDHTTSAHSDQTWRDLPHLFRHSTSDKLVCTDVLEAHGQVFTLHRRFSQAAGEFHAVAQFIGPPEEKDKFTLEFIFLYKNVKISFQNNICADIENIENCFQSSNCVLLEQKSVKKFLQDGSLVCQANITKDETSALSN